jgi:hypothetical protein
MARTLSPDIASSRYLGPWLLALAAREDKKDDLFQEGDKRKEGLNLTMPGPKPPRKEIDALLARRALEAAFPGLEEYRKDDLIAAGLKSREKTPEGLSPEQSLAVRTLMAAGVDSVALRVKALHLAEKGLAPAAPGVRPQAPRPVLAPPAPEPPRPRGAPREE